MRKPMLVFLVLCFLTLLVPSGVQARHAVSQEGYFQDIRLAGRVKVVEYGADLKVKVVTSFPDMKVKVVDSFPADVGEWEFVEYGEDFKIKFVEYGEDVRIKFVDVFPGVV